MSRSDSCIDCYQNVRQRQHGVLCDSCKKWQHRTCNTGITLQQYRDAIDNGSEIAFLCRLCQRRSSPLHEATFITQTSLLSDNTTTDINTTASNTTIEETDPLNRPFNLPDMTINDEHETEESQLGEESLSTSYIQEEIATYTVHEQGSKRGKPLLVSSDGFRYNVKKKQKTSVLWTCSSRSVTVPCYATVVQKGNDFVRGASHHKHGPEVSLNKKISIYVQVKRKAKENVYESTTAIATNARQDHIQPNEPGLPKTETLSRIANRHRAKFRPANPSDLNFVLDQDFLNCQDFLVADISQNNARHIIFATREQLQLLSNTRRWFLDGTFKVVGEPFSSGQLSSIHGFIVNGGVEKQVPMAFILMSRRRTEDYVKVLTSLRDALDEVVVENFVMDFEQAAWLAVRQVFPEASIKGCVFHFTQAVWRKVVEIGLKTAYMQRSSIHTYVRSLMALPFLPARHIEPAFKELASRSNSPAITTLCEYMDSQWMNHPVFDIPSWSVFGLTVRTNNDVEGWHNRLNNATAQQTLNFYRLVPALRSEAEVVKYEVAQVREGTTTRRIRKTSKVIESKIRKVWQQYTDKDIETGDLLRQCGIIYGPQCESGQDC